MHNPGIPRHVFPGQSVATRPLHIMHACLCSPQPLLHLVSDTPVGIGGYRGVCDLTKTSKCAMRAPIFPLVHRGWVAYTACMTDHTVVVNSGLYTLVQLAANAELSTWRAEHPEFGIAVFTCAAGLHISELVEEAEASMTTSGRR